MNFAYSIYQAERTKTQAEQREENRVRGEAAAALARPWRLARARRQARRARRAWLASDPVTAAEEICRTSAAVRR